MPLQNINPTTTKSWEKLTSHFAEMDSFSLKEAFKINIKLRSNLEFTDIRKKVLEAYNYVEKEIIN